MNPMKGEGQPSSFACHEQVQTCAIEDSDMCLEGSDMRHGKFGHAPLNFGGADSTRNLEMNCYGMTSLSTGSTGG
jgi:hypothetical protein